MSVSGCLGRLEGQLAFRDLEFRRVPILMKSTMGTPYSKLVPIGMPKIPQRFLDSVCYLYQDEEKARSGGEFGGTGFIVGVPSRHAGRFFAYVVTNHHVACAGGASVVRLNTVDGSIDVLPFEPDEWHFDPLYDIAVKGIDLVEDRYKLSAIPMTALVTRENVERNKLGVGDDVFMIGRFIDYDGGLINRPAARFGNISVMPSPIEQPNGRMADCYCIDLHSRSGYSGSPVFIYRTPGFDLEERLPSDPSEAKILLSGVNYLMLLGIHFAQFPEEWEIVFGVSQSRKESSSVPLITEGGYVKGLSGMTCVLPSWHILDVLNAKKLREERDATDDKEEATRRQNGYGQPPSPEAS